MLTEVLGPIDGGRIQFSLIDSGAPPDVDSYVTLVCVHGLTFGKGELNSVHLSEQGSNPLYLSSNFQEAPANCERPQVARNSPQ